MEVHRELGTGFLEAVYQEALAIELEARDVRHQREVVLEIYYEGKPLRKRYVADFICFGEVIVETKAQAHLTELDVAQTVNYLKATQQSLGLLINFGGKSLEYKRLIQSAVCSASSAKSA